MTQRSTLTFATFRMTLLLPQMRPRLNPRIGEPRPIVIRHKMHLLLIQTKILSSLEIGIGITDFRSLLIASDRCFVLLQMSNSEPRMFGIHDGEKSMLN